MADGRQPLRLLALGDSLTAGYYYFGSAYHPYAKHLSKLFESVRVPVVINQKGVSGERAVPVMVQRLVTLLGSNDSFYDWILILAGTNDLGSRLSAADIFEQGLKSMYEMVLHRTSANTKLVVMTILRINFYPQGHKIDKKREALNEMIRDYAMNHGVSGRVFLVDLDKVIQYHSMKDTGERDVIWDDGVHLTPAGYDQMAAEIFKVMKRNLPS